MSTSFSNFLKTITFTLSLSLFCGSAEAQEIAVTENGDSVLLYSNGTWEYYNGYISTAIDNQRITENPEKFSKPSSSNTKANGKNQAYEIWFDNKIWKRIPAAEINAEADLAFKFLEGDVYSMIIFEQIEIPIENLSQIALNNAINAAPDMKMIEKEYRTVNGKKVIFMRMEGTAQGIKFCYLSYYYSNEKGSIQFHTFTGRSLLEKNRAEMENMLNGFIVNVN